jgi:hypothetical protein
MKQHIMLDSNYPETLAHVSVINAPKIFSVLFNMLKPFTSKATLAKISIFDHNNWQNEIGKQFPLELIPPKWGGTRAGRDEFCSGDPIWIFGLNEDAFEGNV